MSRKTDLYCPHCGSCRERYFSVKSAAVMLDCSEKCIWNWIRDQEIGVMRFGRMVRIPAGELEKRGVFSPAMKESVEELLSR